MGKNLENGIDNIINERKIMIFLFIFLIQLSSIHEVNAQSHMHGKRLQVPQKKLTLPRFVLMSSLLLSSGGVSTTKEVHVKPCNGNQFCDAETGAPVNFTGVQKANIHLQGKGMYLLTNPETGETLHAFCSAGPRCNIIPSFDQFKEIAQQNYMSVDHFDCRKGKCVKVNVKTFYSVPFQIRVPGYGKPGLYIMNMPDGEKVIHCQGVCGTGDSMDCDVINDLDACKISAKNPAKNHYMCVGQTCNPVGPVKFYEHRKMDARTCKPVIQAKPVGKHSRHKTNHR